METLYRCEICKQMHKSEDACKLCEASHMRIKKIYQQRFEQYKNATTKYPLEIVAEMEDGRFEHYIRSNAL